MLNLIFPIETSIEQKCKRTLLVLHKDTNICMKTIQWRKLWYHFPVVIRRYSGKRAVSFKKVRLPESLILAPMLQHEDTKAMQVQFSSHVLQAHCSCSSTSLPQSCIVCLAVTPLQVLVSQARPSRSGAWPTGLCNSRYIQQLSKCFKVCIHFQLQSVWL